MTKFEDNLSPYLTEVEQGSTPSSPSAGNQKLFIRTSDHLLCYVNSSGTVSVVGGGLSNPLTTTGDTIYSSSGTTAARRGIGSTGDVLTVAGGVPTWAAPAGGTYIGCSAFNSATQGISNATWTALTLDSENFDTTAIHSTSSNTSRMTVPSGKGGKWLFDGYAEFASNTTGLRAVDLYVNGVSSGPMNRVGSPPATADLFTLTTRNVFLLAATDYVELFCYQASGGSLNVGSSSQPQGVLLVATFLGA
jgi:hypothetical protein